MDWMAAYAADGSGPVPMSLDGAGMKLVETGVLGAMLVFALAAIVGLFIEMRRRENAETKARERVDAEHDAERKTWQDQLHALNNQRFIEMREMMVALNTNTAALNVISQAQADRTLSTQELARGLSELGLMAKAIQASLERNLAAISAVHGAVSQGRQLPPPGGL